jgi:lipopolysaccharide/colanic/teichoic acid biosynthesis glycosyltransferase
MSSGVLSARRGYLCPSVQYSGRLSCSGLWQVSGRSCTTLDEMVQLDLRHAWTRSLWTDLKILLATPAG